MLAMALQLRPLQYLPLPHLHLVQQVVVVEVGACQGSRA